VSSVSKRQKEIQQITVDQFKAIRTNLTDVLDMMVLVGATFDLRISTPG
jgi:hypothetical protein